MSTPSRWLMTIVTAWWKCTRRVPGSITLKQFAGLIVSAPGVLSNDFMPNGDPIVALLNTPTQHGKLNLSADGSFTYAPDDDFCGTDSFTYLAYDEDYGNAISAPVTATITVYSIPEANTDSYTVAQGNTLTVNAADGVLANDTNADGNPLTVRLLDGALYGELTLLPDGSFSYMPQPGFIGHDGFGYQAVNGPAVSDTGWVTITVTGSSQVGIAYDGYYVTEAGQILTLAAPGVLAFDASSNGTILTAELNTPTADGMLTFPGDGSFSYTPADGFTGIDTFTYFTVDGLGNRSNSATITILVQPALTAADDSYVDVENQTLEIAAPGVLANDSNPAGGALFVNWSSNALYGTTTIGPDGHIIYVPSADFTGTDSLTYTVSDGINVSPPATVTITVYSIPWTQMDLYDGVSGQTLTVSSDDGLIGRGDCGDKEDLPLTIAMTTPTNNGTLQLNSDGSFSYTSNTGFWGTDVFSYTASDGFAAATPTSVLIYVYPIPVTNSDSYLAVSGIAQYYDDPGVLGNDYTPDGDMLGVLSNTNPQYGTVEFASEGSGAFTYTPDDGFWGTDSFTYVAYDIFDDEDVSAPTTVTMTVYSMPMTHDASYSVASGTTLTVDATDGMLAHVDNADGRPLETILVIGTSYGLLTLLPDGSFTYQPQPGFFGVDSFVYEVANGPAFSDSALVTITVNAAPVASDDAYSVAGGTMLTVDAADGVLANDSYTGGTPTVALDTPPANGTVILNSDGSFQYTPADGFYGVDSFTYTDTSGSLASAPATVLITVYSIPVAVDDSYTAVGGTTLTVDTANGVLANDTNADGTPLSANIQTDPLFGVLEYFNLDGSFSYTPDTGFYGTDSFTYIASDANAGSTPATVTITVYSLPNTNPDNYLVITNQTLSVNTADGVLANDTNADGNPLIAAVLTGPTQGTLNFNDDGSFSYTPVPGFVGTDSFTYTAVNGPISSPPTMVTINVITVPFANPDSYATAENTVLNAGSVLANDTVGNAAAPILSALLVAPPQKGVLMFNSDGTFIYIPPTYFVGTQTFTYEAVNAAGNSAPVTVTITVTNANLSPVAYPGTLTVPANTSTTGFLTSFNPAGGPIVYSIPSQGRLGTATVTDASTGAYTYTPNLGASGTDTFTFMVAYADNPAMNSTATITVTIQGGNPSVSVFVTANIPSAQLIGTPVTYTATASGIPGTLEYEFVAQVKNADGTWSTVQVISGWSTDNQCTWTTSIPKTYAVEAYVRPVGSGVPYTAYGYILYTFLPDNLTGATLTANLPSPQLINTAIGLTATALGGIAPGAVEYQFVAQYRNPDGTWAPNILIRDWNTNGSCVWQPTSVQNYYLEVYVRPVGMTTSYVVDTFISFITESVSLTGVTISANLPAPQAVGTAINLTATAQGGITYPNVEYQFVAQYKLPNGTWAPNILIRDYDTNPQCTWTASAASKYYLNVYARPVGSTVPYVVTSYIVYVIQ